MQTPIDTVVCLGTPHIHLKGTDFQQQTCYVSVFCTAATRKNTSKIVCLNAEGDEVTKTWSNLVTRGIKREEAVQLATPRLQADKITLQAAPSLLQSITKRSDLVAMKTLSLADQTATLNLGQPDPLGIRPHAKIHDPIVGEHLGNWLSGKSLP
ncbi:MAG: hypothetical protein AAFP90_23225 [Planctomycetota bacterium]